MSLTIKANINSFRFEQGQTLDWGGVECNINEGGICVVTGMNGSGKTTFLKVLCGIYPIFKQRESKINGSIECSKNGASGKIQPSIVRESPDIITSGYVSQAPAANLVTPLEALPQSTIERELAFPLEHVFFNRNKLWQQLKYGKGLLKERNIDYLGCPSRLSKGQQQIVSIVTMLIASPDVLILDEPSSFLDEDNLNWLWILINKSIKEGIIKCCVLSTQDKRLLELSKSKATTINLPVTLKTKKEISVNTISESLKYLSLFNVGEFKMKALTVRSKTVDFQFGDISLSPGDYAIISGNNGSGKSTLCEALTGYRNNQITGKITIGDWSHNCGYKKYVVPPKVAYGFQNAEDQITHTCILRELARPAKCEQWLEYGIPIINYITGGRTTNPWKLSYGQRKLLTISSMCFTSSILLIDEPFSSLDYKSVDLLQKMLNNYLRHKGIIIQTSSLATYQGKAKKYNLKNGSLLQMENLNYD